MEKKISERGRGKGPGRRGGKGRGRSRKERSLLEGAFSYPPIAQNGKNKWRFVVSCPPPFPPYLHMDCVVDVVGSGLNKGC